MSPAAPPAEDNRLIEPIRALFERVPLPWRAVTDRFLASPRGRALADYVDGRVAGGASVYPKQVFRALDFQPPDGIRAVVIGQDPYHGPGQAQGLAFSVPRGHRPLPPSLRNVLKEVLADMGRPSPSEGDLSHWARQGVLLLNTVLTVERGLPQSHAGRGWESLTDALLTCVLRQPRPRVLMLWGASAQRKLALAREPGMAEHHVLSSNHPSPLSALRGPAPFVGCGHFRLANERLLADQPGATPIDW